VISIANAAFEQGFGCNGVVASSLPGPAGNVEYFLWLKKDAPALSEVDLDLAIQMGPE
jgi:23S rRNA (cytidine1920-2'-O)/16S rRNA (cytidine1409-2'-O)-methyltransferase